MKRMILLLACAVALGGVVLAQHQTSENPASPYPGGGPFPPGHEPLLTHTATAFWTTRDGLMTEIRIQAGGERPTQYDCWKAVDGKKELLRGGISPDCRYDVLIYSARSSPPPKIGAIAADGEGWVEVRAFGFKREDFAAAPTLAVTYSRNGQAVAETKIVAHPMPEKFANSK